MQNKQETQTGAFSSVGLDVLLGRRFASDADREAFFAEIQKGMVAYLIRCMIEDCSEEDATALEKQMSVVPEEEKQIEILLERIKNLSEATQITYGIAFKKAVFQENLAQMSVVFRALENKTITDTTAQSLLQQQRRAYTAITQAITNDDWDAIVDHLPALYSQDLLTVYGEAA